MEIQSYNEGPVALANANNPYLFLSLNLSEPQERIRGMLAERIISCINSPEIQIYLDLLKTEHDYGEVDTSIVEQNCELLFNRLLPLTDKIVAFNLQYPIFSFSRSLENTVTHLLSGMKNLRILKLISYVLKDYLHNHEIILSLRNFPQLQYLSLRCEIPADWLVFPCVLPQSLRKVMMTLTICSLSGRYVK